MIDVIGHTFPSQFSVIAMAQASQTSLPLFRRAVLMTHILRSFARAEEMHGGGRIHPEGFLGSQTLDARMAYWRHPPFGGAPNQWSADAERFIAESRECFKAAYRLSALEKTKDVEEITELGLSFIFSLEAADRKNKENAYYPLYETNPFIALGISLEVLHDINQETKKKAGKNFTDLVDFDPLNLIEKFYHRTKKLLPANLIPRDAPVEKTDEAVKILADLGDKTGTYMRSLYNNPGLAPHASFTNMEGMSLNILYDFLQPYKAGRSLVIKSQQREGDAPTALLMDFAERGEKIRRKRTGIRREFPAAAPAQP